MEPRPSSILLVNGEYHSTVVPCTCAEEPRQKQPKMPLTWPLAFFLVHITCKGTEILANHNANQTLITITIQEILNEFYFSLLASPTGLCING